ncbi:MAG: hypothetical protein M1823_001774 [Watsoniomyces obsoletus]|nr:MAG: hypothetical protein M1823_001774 [Watsoniomyces obsoletus]
MRTSDPRPYLYRRYASMKKAEARVRAKTGFHGLAVVDILPTTKSTRYTQWWQLERRLMSEVVGVRREIHIPQLTVGRLGGVLGKEVVSQSESGYFDDFDTDYVLMMIDPKIFKQNDVTMIAVAGCSMLGVQSMSGKLDGRSWLDVAKKA